MQFHGKTNTIECFLVKFGFLVFFPIFKEVFQLKIFYFQKVLMRRIFLDCWCFVMWIGKVLIVCRNIDCMLNKDWSVETMTVSRCCRNIFVFWKRSKVGTLRSKAKLWKYRKEKKTKLWRYRKEKIRLNNSAYIA